MSPYRFALQKDGKQIEELGSMAMPDDRDAVAFARRRALSESRGHEDPLQWPAVTQRRPPVALRSRGAISAARCSAARCIASLPALRALTVNRAPRSPPSCTPRRFAAASAAFVLAEIMPATSAFGALWKSANERQEPTTTRVTRSRQLMTEQREGSPSHLRSSRYSPFRPPHSSA